MFNFEPILELVKIMAKNKKSKQSLSKSSGWQIYESPITGSAPNLLSPRVRDCRKSPQRRLVVSSLSTKESWPDSDQFLASHCEFVCTREQVYVTYIDERERAFAMCGWALRLFPFKGGGPMATFSY